MQQYTDYFNDIVTCLPNTPNAELVHPYIFGLKAPIKGFVKAQISSTGGDPPLEEVTVLAKYLEENVDVPT